MDSDHQSEFFEHLKKHYEPKMEDNKQENTEM